MLYQKDIDVHFWLTRGLARRMGVNLTEAMRFGVLTRTDFAQMVSRCRECSAGVQACISFLAEADPAQGLSDACANKSILEDLRGLS